MTCRNGAIPISEPKGVMCLSNVPTDLEPDETTYIHMDLDLERS